MQYIDAIMTDFILRAFIWLWDIWPGLPALLWVAVVVAIYALVEVPVSPKRES